ncbi:MAG: hypothetical protein ACE5IK_00260 [Acidobacteriota bacterium]
MSGGSTRRWVARLGVGLVAMAVGGVGIFWIMFSSWSDLATVDESAAAAVFAEAIARSGGGVPYVEIPADGPAVVHRELERDTPADLRRLHLLGWDPAGRRLLRIDFPFWFVKAKMTRSVNLGTLTSALSGDWQHLDLRVSEEDLQRRGPALVLDTSRADGARLLLWTD